MRYGTKPSGPEIAGRIMRRIENGRYRAGERIIPGMIADELGISAIPVREALCTLVGRDIVEERHNRGFFIAPMTSATLHQLYAAHGLIVDLALQRFVEGRPLANRPRNHWPLFAAIAKQSGDAALAGLQFYLSGRLALFRKPAESLFSAMGMTWNIADMLRKGEVRQARSLITEYHEICQIHSREIWTISSDR
ncbi:transcriptional regulator, GntR family [Sphingobium chlorophenolicum L-1]|uniref:Transcriptional regulator, GntR family n=2 Tax=Sphingobium chlorophenolicum TaxID=46429 RepID=F6F0N9_SPHCR|nr:transcriptional regulator, GntR family [Sphingobium chlorophenolicum L-1]